MSSTRIAELVGLPGVGKSTLFEALLASDRSRITRPRIDRRAQLPYLVKNTLQALVPFAAQYRHTRGSAWRKYRKMVQLGTFYDVLPRNGSAPPELVLLDQGPVYLLTVLHGYRPAAAEAKSEAFERFWEATVARWAERLDLIVLLDADDDILYERNRLRAKANKVAAMSRAEAHTYLRRTRAAHALVLEMLQRQPSCPAVVRFDTGCVDLDEAVPRLSQVLLEPPHLTSCGT